MRGLFQLTQAVTHFNKRNKSSPKVHSYNKIKNQIFTELGIE